MHIFLVLILVLALVACLVAMLSGYAGQPPGQPAGWTRTNFLALGVALYVLYVLIVVLTGPAVVPGR
jgi:hypothetical protein